MRIMPVTKDMKGVCKEIDLIIDKQDNKNDYKYLFLDLEDILSKNDFSEIDIFCKTVLKMSKTKNRTLRYLEYHLWVFINAILHRLLLNGKIESVENESIELNMDYDNQGKKILSSLMGLSKEILELPDDGSNGSELRRAGSLKFFAKLIDFYYVKDVKELFVDSIRSKNKDEQYAALEGLVNYYDIIEEEIDDNLIDALNYISKETAYQTVVSMCLQIQINAGIIDDCKEAFYD